MRRGLLLLVTVALGAVVLAACLPPPPPPAPSTPTTTRAVAAITPPSSTTSSTTTTSTTTTSTTAPPSGGAWAQNGPLGSCHVFPADNAWNRDVSGLPVDANSANYIAAITALGGNQKLHADFGGGGAYGIPYITVPGTQPLVPVDFDDYGDESDPGPYPIPLAAPVEGGSDAHVLAVDRDHCKLYELFAASRGHEPLVGRLRRGVRPHVERVAARRVDVGRRRRAPDLPRVSSATTRWRAGTSTTRCASRCRSRSGPICTRRRTGRRRAPTPTCPPMGLRLRLKASFNASALHRPGARRARRAQEVRDDRRRQRQQLVHQRRRRHAAGTTPTSNQLKTVPGQRVRGGEHGRVAAQLARTRT